MSGRIDGALSWERLGATGHPMAFLHPLPADRSAWLYQQAHFSTWFRTIAIDLPGYGRSPSAAPGLTAQEIADACWDAIDETSTGPAILVGLSMGSTVAQFMAATRPDRTLALVLTGGGWFPATDTRFHTGLASSIDRYEREGLAAREAELARNYGPAFRDTELGRYLTRLFVERNSTADPVTIAETYRVLQTPVPEDLHRRVKAPTLVITGGADPGTAAHRALAARISGSQLRVMEGAGHLCNAERPWEYDTLVLQFLRAQGLLA